MGSFATVQPSKHPRYAWEVQYIDRSRREPGGRARRVTKYFTAREAADQAARTLDRTISTSGTVALALDAKARADFFAAREVLAEAGWPKLALVDVARDFATRCVRPAVSDERVAVLLEEFLRVKRVDENKSPRWVETLKTRLNSWLRQQHIARLHDITRQSCLAVRSREGVGARTRRNDMAAVSTFLAWLKQERWVNENFLEDIAPPQTDATSPRVLTAAQVAALLEAARRLGNGRLLRFFALGIFAGLRPSELERLPEERIHLTRQNAVVRVIGGKRRQRVRIVPVMPVLRAWLAIAPKVQPIADLASRDRLLFDQVRQAAGLVQWEGELQSRRTTVFNHWQADIMRHTYISLRMGITHDENLVAMEAGNSPDVIHAHYLSLLTPAETRALLAVRPGRKG